MANRGVNERQELLLSMFEPDDVLLSADGFVLRKGTRRELTKLMVDAGYNEMVECFKEIRGVSQESISHAIADTLYKATDPDKNWVVGTADGELVGSFSIKYEDDVFPPRAWTVLLDPWTSEDVARVLALLIDVAHRLNGDEEVEVRCRPYAFGDRAAIESLGGYIHHFEEGVILPPEDREVFAASWGDLLDDEIKGLAAGFGVSDESLFCGSLIYRIPYGAARQEVRDDRFGPKDVGQQEAVWVLRDMVMRFNTASDLMTSGHPLKGIRALKDLFSALKRFKSFSSSNDKDLDDMEESIRAYEEELRRWGEEE